MYKLQVISIISLYLKTIC